ncbi:hypothetical protein GH714_009235 [Hevea brasiliensis]|uniref:Myb/SANT-like domain-containing protein n=1 Tax=Hevea brasiliensis TaxID=3981 RepID=A0A6A6M0D1_HEVBR|nr:hypothetical protein GH714_009235 [Hevea brasiliensis]
MATKNKGAGRVAWSSEQFNLFVKICIRGTNLGKRNGGGWGDKGYTWLQNELRQVGVEYTKEQLRHKWDWMKDQWKMWKALKGNETGLGWDPIKGTVVAPDEWTQLSLPRKLFSCQVKLADSGVDGSFSSQVVPPTLLSAEKEEAKAVLTLFLKKQGLSNAVATGTINKSDLFIDHLVSRLHSVHKSWYLVGRELTTLEIRDARIPYLESLLEEHRSVLVDLVENFPNPSVKGKPVQPLSPSQITLDFKKLKAVSRVSETDPAGKLPPHIVYLMDLGMNLEQIKGITCRFPAFAYCSLEGKIKPVVELLLDLGVPKSDLPTILVKRPQLCGISLSENLIPTMTFLENWVWTRDNGLKLYTVFQHF